MERGWQRENEGGRKRERHRVSSLCYSSLIGLTLPVLFPASSLYRWRFMGDSCPAGRAVPSAKDRGTEQIKNKSLYGRTGKQDTYSIRHNSVNLVNKITEDTNKVFFYFISDNNMLNLHHDDKDEKSLHRKILIMQCFWRRNIEKSMIAGWWKNKALSNMVYSMLFQVFKWQFLQVHTCLKVLSN